MSQILRQSTQVIVRIGPAVAVGDGFTPVTSLTLAGADEAELLKANTTTTTDISGATMAAITGCDGWYGLTLTTSLSDTVGCLDVMINDDSLILPIFARFQVIEEAAYDAMYAASADPKADINVGSIDAGAGVPAAGVADSGSTTTMVDAARTEAATDYWKGMMIHFASGASAGQSRLITAFDSATDTITFTPAVTSAIATNDVYEIRQWAGVDLRQILGTAVSTPATAGILDVNIKNIDNDAASASGTVTFPNATLASTTNITAGTITTATNVTTVNGLAANVITAAATATDFGTEVASAVWDMDATGHQTQGTFGQAIGDPVADTNTIFKAVVTDATGATVGVDVAAVLDDTGTSGVVVASLANNSITAAAAAADFGTEVGTAVWATAARTLTAATNITSTGAAVPITAGGLVSGDVTAISTDTAAADNAESFFDGTGYAGTNNIIPTVTTLTNLPAITANWLTAAGTAADFGTEVSNAVWAKTLTELTGVPAANAAVIDALNLLFMAVRNARNTTATSDQITNDAGAAIASATLSDDGVTFVKTEYS